ncbi:MAG: hypothetical protein R3223_10860 [Longimicrobiales bacterium]|nr:hypothetical protein [Longimicrobiales bacterium]
MNGPSSGSGDREDSGRNGEEASPDEPAQSPKEESEDEETRRPISVRDLMPSPPSRPSRRTPERPERPERTVEPERTTEPEREVGEPEEEAGGPVVEEGVEEATGEPSVEPDAGEPEVAEAAGPAGSASVPTPVRVAMDAPPPGDSRPPEELPSRRFEVEDQEWIVRISGRTITGTRPDPGALLMYLSFFRADDPEDPRRRLVTVDRPLDALYEEDLRELYQRSRPTERSSSGSE